MKKNSYILGVIMILVMGALAGCSQNEAQPKLIPEPPSETLQKEPIITLYLHETGETKSVPLEEYLCGVVAAEMAVDWPMEALAAQAMMARTFTLEKIATGGVPKRGTDASTDILEFQAYDASKVNDAVRQAVAATRGRTIRYQGEWIKAWFFADGGGITADSSVEGLGYNKTQTPYIKSVEDPGKNLADNPNNSWTASFPVDQVKQAITHVTGNEAVVVDQVTIAEQGPSGRTTKLQFGDVVVSGPALRLALGGQEMKSTLLEHVEVSEGALKVTGRGYGHGVGMSQWGARALAEQGKTADEIIHYFLQDVEIIQEYQ